MLVFCHNFNFSSYCKNDRTKRNLIIWTLRYTNILILILFVFLSLKLYYFIRFLVMKRIIIKSDKFTTFNNKFYYPAKLRRISPDSYLTGLKSGDILQHLAG